MISTRLVELVIDTVVCLTLAKWETVSGQFGGYLTNRFANVYSNLNQFYMAGLMTASIVVIELALMGSVYDNKNANIVIIAVSVVALGAFFLGIRQQAAIGDKSFLTSMIPHHAEAILMCERAPIQDVEIKKLCGEIISSQQREIDQMKSMLARLRP
jgi:hypothetical protein